MPHTPRNRDWWVPPILAIMTVAAFLGYIGLITFFPFTKPPDTGFVNLAIGWLGGIATTVMGWYFGGAREQNRDFTITRQTPQPPVVLHPTTAEDTQPPQEQQSP